MEFDLTTLVFEIINFLVLVWLLHRFLYRPVLRVIDRRRESIEQQLAEARETREEAERLAGQHREQVAAWEQERRQAQARLRSELEQERERAQARLEEELDEQREKRRVTEERRRVEQRRRLDEDALALATRFSARVLERVAGPELQASLLSALVTDLEHIPEDLRQGFRDSLQAPNSGVHIASAYPLDEPQRNALEEALQKAAGERVHCAYEEDPSLVAGVRVSLPHWVLGVNLADELRYFREQGNAEATR